MRLNVRYVHKHPKSGTFRYRRRVPKHLRDVLGGEIIRSLGTEDPHVAARKAEGVQRDVERLFAQVSPKANESPLETFERVKKHLEMQGLNAEGPDTLNPEEARSAYADAILRKYERELGQEPAPEDLSREDLYKVRILKGSTKAPTLTIKDALRIYLQEKGQGRRNAAAQRHFVRERQRCVEMLVSTISNKAVLKVTRADARQYRDYLTEHLKSVSSVNKYIRYVQAIFQVAIDERELQRQNPFAKLQLHDPVAAKEKRGSFTDKQLEKIVQTAIRKDGLRQDLKHVLLLLLDTGARLGEITGLAREDVILSGEVPHIFFRPNDIRFLKTKASKRKVPLIGQALIAAKEACRVAERRGVKALFPVLAVDRGSANASGSLNKFLKIKAKVKRDRLTVHSLRHTFKDRMRNAGVPEDVRDLIQGHENPKISGDYGEGYSLRYLKKQLDKVKVVTS